MYRDAVIWDNHACMPLRPNDTKFLNQLERYEKSGATVVSLNVGFDAHLDDQLAPFKMLTTFRKWITENNDNYLLVETVDDIFKAKQENKIGICFDLEGGSAVQDDPGLIIAYYKLGVRWMLIAYNKANSLGGGCQEKDTGLTNFGRSVIDEMERVGMVLCCSHTGYKTAMEAIDYSNNPVIFSHSNPLGLHNHERNIPDDLIKACAQKRGVVNINGVSYFLKDNDISIDNYIHHVNYIAELVGPEFVGIGLDYCFDTSEVDELMNDNPDFFPPGKGYENPLQMITPESIPNIAKALYRDGWNLNDIKGFLGANNLRVAQEVWR